MKKQVENVIPVFGPQLPVMGDINFPLIESLVPGEVVGEFFRMVNLYANNKRRETSIIHFNVESYRNRDGEPSYNFEVLVNNIFLSLSAYEYNGKWRTYQNSMSFSFMRDVVKRISRREAAMKRRKPRD